MGMASLYRRFAVPVFWTVLAFVYAIAIMPSPDAPDLGAGDKVNHIAAFLTLSFLGRAGYRFRPVWQLAIGLSLFGALIELTQSIPILRRDGNISDWAADSAAIIVALAISLACERRFLVRATA
ncbi:MAG: hypothetical protein EOP61_14710 [Sphingomonadales bacterium]|nr:MAG: hypothetical protein EOP61_14710 [Sphingomonadales bacterium]